VVRILQLGAVFAFLPLSGEITMRLTRLFAGMLCCLMFLMTLEVAEAQGLRDRIRARWNSRLNARISPYYEPDRLADVTEWFDGNSYNPSNEVLDRWSDRSQRPLTRAERANNFQNYENWYGFETNTNANANWFYDYYDHGYYFNTTPDAYYSYRYYDTNNDGIYDTYTTYLDGDRDGRYDNEQWYTFDYEGIKGDDPGKVIPGDAAKAQQPADDKMPTISSQMTIAGTVIRTKTTKTPQSNHIVIEVKGDADKSMFVDIGPATSAEEWKITEGAKIEATGPVVVIGDKQLMLADKISVNSNAHEVTRQNARSWTGVIADTKVVPMGGEEVLLGIVYTPDKERVLVDFGPKSRFDAELEQNAEITIQGVPMKVKDRQIIMAHSVEYGGNTTTIYRMRSINKPNER
jgi:hypothetical protein